MGQIHGLNWQSNCLVNNHIGLADKLPGPWSETWDLGGVNCRLRNDSVASLITVSLYFFRRKIASQLFLRLAVNVATAYLLTVISCSRTLALMNNKDDSKSISVLVYRFTPYYGLTQLTMQNKVRSSQVVHSSTNTTQSYILTLKKSVSKPASLPPIY